MSVRISGPPPIEIKIDSRRFERDLERAKERLATLKETVDERAHRLV
jgi:multidrug resistance efflux pump